jgi:hypothetical protein
MVMSYLTEGTALGDSGVLVLAALASRVPSVRLLDCDTDTPGGAPRWQVAVPWPDARAFRLAVEECCDPPDRDSVSVLTVSEPGFTMTALTSWPVEDLPLAVAATAFALDDVLSAGVASPLFPDADLSWGSVRAVLTGSRRDRFAVVEQLVRAAAVHLGARQFGEPLDPSGPTGVLAVLLSGNLASRPPADDGQAALVSSRLLVDELAASPELMDVARGLDVPGAARQVRLATSPAADAPTPAADRAGH